MKDRFGNEILLSSFPEDVRKVITKCTELVENAIRIPNMILFGEGGRGKTTACLFLAEQLNAEVFCFDLRDAKETAWMKQVERFAGTAPSMIDGSKNFKIVIVNECDKIPDKGKAFNRILDNFPNCIFLFTTNNHNKLDPTFKSRNYMLNVVGDDLRQSAISNVFGF